MFRTLEFECKCFSKFLTLSACQTSENSSLFREYLGRFARGCSARQSKIVYQSLPANLSERRSSNSRQLFCSCEIFTRVEFAIPARVNLMNVRICVFCFFFAVTNLIALV